MATTPSQRARKFDSPGHYTKKDRDSMDESDFAGSSQTYPIKVPQDVEDAAGLIGNSKHDSPETLKANIIKIAKRKGAAFVAKLPDSWKEGGDDRAESASETRGAMPDTVEQVYVAPISRVDPEKRLVTVTATSEAVDSFGTVFDYEASKKAFTDWIGNVREMHQPKAVGSRVAVHCDDGARKIDVTLRISKGAQDTWEKVLDGTLRGASIGASNVMWEHPTTRDGKPVPRARDYKLVELSLVDNPSNPDCLNIAVMRNATPDATLLDEISDSTQETRMESTDPAGTPATVDSAAQLAAAAAAEVERARQAFEADAAADLTREMRALPAEVPSAARGLVAVTGVYDPSAPLGAVAVPGAPVSADELRAAAATTPAIPANPAAAAAAALGNLGLSAMLPDRVHVAPQIYAATIAREQRARAKDAFIAQAGNAAQGDVAAWDSERETYDRYIARMREARATAEKDAVLIWQARERQEGTQEAEQSAATPPAEPQRAVVADAPAPDADPATNTTGEATAERAAAPSDTPHDSGETVTGPALPAPAVSGTPQPSGAQGKEEHVNLTSAEHEHQMPDGSRMRHAHPHVSGEHLHTFRAGQPIDSRLVTAEDLRAGWGVKADAVSQHAPLTGSQDTGELHTAGSTPANGAVSPILTVQPQAVGHAVIYNTQDAASLSGGVPAAAAKPKATPTGDITLEAGDFHVGGHTEAHGEATGQYDEDGDHDGGAEDSQPPVVSGLNPAPTRVPREGRTPNNSGKSAGLGQVNTTSAGRAQAAPMAPMAQIPSAALTAIQTLLQTGALTDDEAAALTSRAGANATNHGVVNTLGEPSLEGPGPDDDSGEYAEAEGDDGDADDVATPARPPRASALIHDAASTEEVGKDPADTAIDVQQAGPLPAGGTASNAHGVAGGLSRAGAEAEAPRRGSRLSADSRTAIHAVRDGALQAVRQACEHCNGDGECPECQDMLAVLNGGLYDPTGDHSPDDDSAPNASADDSEFGSERMVRGAGRAVSPTSIRLMQALFLRELGRMQRAHAAQLDTATTALERIFAARLEAERAELRAEVVALRAQLADTHLTLADTQRGTAVQMSGQITEQITSALDERLSRLPSQSGGATTHTLEQSLDTRFAAVTQRLEAVASSVEGLEAGVERIAMQPMPGGPITSGATPLTPDTQRMSAGANGMATPSTKTVALAPDPRAQSAAALLTPDLEMEALQRLAANLPAGDAARMTIAARMAQLSARVVQLPQ